ncbi:hypothetical protein [Kangiella sp. M94]
MAISIADLWLPILLSGLFAWIASALIHMLIKYHNSDYQKLNNEDDIAKAIAEGKSKVGFYTLPHCADFKEMEDPKVQQRFKDGPVAIVTIIQNGLPPMGKLLIQQLLFFVIGSLLIGYIGSIGMVAGAPTGDIFRLLFVAGFICFGWASIPYSIWFGHPWSVTSKYLMDAIIYAVVVASTFCWLWPKDI